MTEEISLELVQWLECVPWDREESSLPVGEQMVVPNMTAMSFVYRWIIIDAEEDNGYRLVRRKELTDDDTIVGAQINESTVRITEDTYGDRFFVAASPGKPDVLLTRREWREEHGSDVLVLQAIWQIRHMFGADGV